MRERVKENGGDGGCNEWDGNGGIKEERMSVWADKGVKSVKESVKGVGGWCR